MNKKYVYRKHIQIMKWFILIPLGLLSLLILVLGLIYGESGDVLAGVLFGLYSYGLFYILNRFKKISIELTEEAVIYTNAKGVRIIPYDQISSIDSASIRYTGGWMIIKTVTGKPIRLTVVVQSVGEFIFAFKEKLNELGMQSKYNEDKLFAFYKTSVYSDQSWERSYYFFPRFLPTLIVEAVIGTIIAVLNSDYHIPYIVYAIILGILPYMYIEFGIYAKRISRYVRQMDWELPPLDKEEEHKHMQYSYLFFLIAGCIALLAEYLL
ncbi:MAG: hypothetical protein AB7U79_00570 [Candidatus Izemoplasmatales bacterium]